MDLLDALPDRFSFFHLGEVALQERASSLPLDAHQGLQAIGYSLRGELEGWLVIGVDPAADYSVYSELGNIIASQLATRLSREQGLEIMISPPQRLAPPQVGQLLSAGVITQRTYLHADRGLVVPVETWIIAKEVKGVGHA